MRIEPETWTWGACPPRARSHSHSGVKPEALPEACSLEPDIRRATFPGCVAGELAGADRIRNGAVFIGTYPGLTRALLDYMAETITRFVRSK